MLDNKTKKKILDFQKSEITEHFIYDKLSQVIKGSHNKDILKQISKDELRHYNFWKSFTDKEVCPSKFQIWKYYLISRIFGLTFGVKLMEKGEGNAQIEYDKISKIIPEAKKIVKAAGKIKKHLGRRIK